jgi:hypothetical protein
MFFLICRNWLFFFLFLNPYRVSICLYSHFGEYIPAMNHSLFAAWICNDLVIMGLTKFQDPRPKIWTTTTRNTRNCDDRRPMASNQPIVICPAAGHSRPRPAHVCFHSSSWHIMVQYQRRALFRTAISHAPRLIGSFPTLPEAQDVRVGPRRSRAFLVAQAVEHHRVPEQEKRNKTATRMATTIV